MPIMQAPPARAILGPSGIDREVLGMRKPEPINREQMIRQLIAVRAYEIWESHGRPSGHDAAHWRQAEQDIMACLAEGTTAEALVASKSTTPPGRTRNSR
ncbi:MAG: DUF2934 domain-containing protein [Rhodopila sp.]